MRPKQAEGKFPLSEKADLVTRIAYPTRQCEVCNALPEKYTLSNKANNIANEANKLAHQLAREQKSS